MAAAAAVPADLGRRLRACLRCGLVKAYEQFAEGGCDNCPFFALDRDADRVADATTSAFSGLVSSMDPASSWAARWLRISKFAPGCYALSVTGQLSEELQAVCEENNVRYVPRS
eukprot:SM000061S19205  [mRNA]  locus=s61:145961:146302:+ [translate_table: standard]